MKKNFLSICLVLAIVIFNGLTLSAQEAEVSTVISTKFNNMYSGVTEIIWEQDGMEYLATFIKDGFSLDATFLEDGTWQQTVTSLEIEDLPTAAKELLTKEYKVESYYYISRVETPAATQFSVNLETDTQYVTLMLNKEGKLVDKQVEDL